MKRCAINTYKHGIYELPHELPNNLRLYLLNNLWRNVFKKIEDLIPEIIAFFIVLSTDVIFLQPGISSPSKGKDFLL